MKLSQLLYIENVGCLLDALIDICIGEDMGDSHVHVLSCLVLLYAYSDRQVRLTSWGLWNSNEWMVEPRVCGWWEGAWEDVCPYSRGKCIE